MQMRTAQELWATYLQLSRELNKFLDRQDIAMVTSLLDQREKLQAMIDEQSDAGFRRSAEGREIVACIRLENQAIDRKMRQSYNAVRQQRTIADAYDGKSYVGSLMDHKR
jgi:arginyl-tRNA--protein-N-Asp/Glu arginylyltransferase